MLPIPETSDLALGPGPGPGPWALLVNWSCEAREQAEAAVLAAVQKAEAEAKREVPGIASIAPARDPKLLQIRLKFYKILENFDSNFRFFSAFRLYFDLGI